MVSQRPIPWYDLPAREFPAKRWLRKRYPFYIPPSLFARYTTSAGSAAPVWRRPFPAKVWLAAQQSAA